MPVTFKNGNLKIGMAMDIKRLSKKIRDNSMAHPPPVGALFNHYH